MSKQKIRVRFLCQHLNDLIKEFNLNCTTEYNIKNKQVSKCDKYHLYHICKDTYLVKYFTIYVSRTNADRSTINFVRHNYFLYGPSNEVHDILDVTCNKTRRGCLLPLPTKLDKRHLKG